MERFNFTLTNPRRSDERRNLIVIHELHPETGEVPWVLVVLENHCSLVSPAHFADILHEVSTGKQEGAELEDLRARNGPNDQGCWDGMIHLRPPLKGPSIPGTVNFAIHPGHGIAEPWTMKPEDVSVLIRTLQD